MAMQGPKVINQGGRNSLPGSPQWCYLELDFLFEMLKHGDVVLIKGSWLLECYKARCVLPRRQELQELHPEAVWSLDDLKDAKSRGCFEFHGDREIELVSVSHCWFTESHPDPNGTQLQDIGPILDARLSCRPRGATIPGKRIELAVFWCWCSFYQAPFESDAQKKALERAMDTMDIWYTHKWTNVWMLTKVPSGVRAYEERGWTTWESTVSRFVPTDGHGDPRIPLDIGLLDKCSDPHGSISDSVAPDFYLIREICGIRSTSPPLLPEEFIKEIREKTFTKGITDRRRVEENYERNFKEVMSVISEFKYTSAREHFGCLQAKQLARALVFCIHLERLDLCGSYIGDDGAVALAEILPRLESLQWIGLSSCGIAERGASALAKALPQCRGLADLWIDFGNAFADASKQHLKQACGKVVRYH